MLYAHLAIAGWAFFYPYPIPFYGLRLVPVFAQRHLCPMIIAKKNGRGFRFSDTIWESLSAAQRAEFSDVENIVPPVHVSNARRVQVPPEVVAMERAVNSHKEAAEGNGPDNQGVTGRDEHEDDEQPRKLGNGLKSEKSKKAAKK